MALHLAPGRTGKAVGVAWPPAGGAGGFRGHAPGALAQKGRLFFLSATAVISPRGNLGAIDGAIGSEQLAQRFFSGRPGQIPDKNTQWIPPALLESLFDAVPVDHLRRIFSMPVRSGGAVNSRASYDTSTRSASSTASGDSEK